MEMDIQHTRNETGGRFYIPEPDEKVTELLYRLSGKIMIIDHTEVSEKHEGKGIGKKLVVTAIDYARQHVMKVLPICPFANAIMEKAVEYQDVLAGYSE